MSTTETSTDDARAATSTAEIWRFLGMFFILFLGSMGMDLLWEAVVSHQLKASVVLSAFLFAAFMTFAGAILGWFGPRRGKR